MQRVSALLPTWDRGPRTSHSRKSSLEKVRGWADKIPASVNRLSGSRSSRETYWPGTLDKETEKAARILRSFCSDGFLAPDDRPGSPQTFSSTNSSNQIMRKIPPRIIQNAVGLAIFTSTRSGLWTSGSGGSGILLSRKTDGTWSPPSALMLQTASLGFVIGIDIYDCVLVINNFTVLEIFARPKVTLGTDVQLVTGPLLSLGMQEVEPGMADLGDTALTYIKAKGQIAEVKLDGTILNERFEENERFYGMPIGVAKILAGDINQSLPQTRPLTEMLKAAEGRSDYDVALVEQLASQPTPGDALIESPNSNSTSPQPFGIPVADDPDPFGVLALEMAGMEIREAGTHLRPESSQFDYNPSPTSPVFPKLCRRSVDTSTSRSNRGSYMSSRTMATERSQFTDLGIHNYVHTPETTPSPSLSQSEDGHPQHSSDDIPEVEEPEEKQQKCEEQEEIDYTKIDISALRKLSSFPDLEDEPITSPPTKEEVRSSEDRPDSSIKVDSTPSVDEKEGDADDEEDGSLNGLDDMEDGTDDDDDFEDGEEPVIFEVATAQAPQRMPITAAQVFQAKGAVVTIPRRLPPPLPLRSPARASRQQTQMGSDPFMVSSPLRQEFDADFEPEGVATPRAEDGPANWRAGDVNQEADSVKGDAIKSTSGSTTAPMPPTPSRNSYGLNGQLSEANERPTEQNEVAPRASNPQEEADFKPSAGVPVTVA